MFFGQAKNIVLFACVLFFCFSSTANAQTELSEIRKQVEECTNAFMAGDYDKFAERVHPKLLRLMGGKEKMIAQIGKDLNEMKERGVLILSVSVDLPKEIITIGKRRFSMTPYRLKMKVPDGFLITPTFMLGVWEGKVSGWKFLDGAGLTDAKLKVLFPEAVGKLKLLEKQPPVFQKSQD